mgnify:CR=1 FL=1
MKNLFRLFAAAALLMMGAAYGASLLIDHALFADVVLGQSPFGQVAAKLGVHTALILGYLAAAWKLISR